MFAQERHRILFDTLQKRSPLTVPELEKLLHASPATIRRDLTFLEKTGKIVRTHGGVLHPDHARGEVPFDRKSKAALNTKAALARAAAALVQPGETVFVDAGTTALETGRRLLAIGNLTIFTNSIPLLAEAARADTRSRVVALGGEVRAISQALTGGATLDWMDRLQVDIAFLGASGIDAAEGPSTTELSEAGVKGRMLTRAKRVVLLADASKWMQPAAIRYAGWAQIHDIVTDHVLTRTERGALAKSGTRLHVVKK
ncbi:transcriptional regulator of sugar metabolism [Opitutaceae bacterium TAV1]|nr:transcriptional regulator of sugar metabolism [Opitutaceae bacterium TAV1]